MYVSNCVLYKYVCIDESMYACKYVYICTYGCIYTYVRKRIYLNFYMCMLCMYECLHA